jgi:hypothetical protein
MSNTLFLNMQKVVRQPQAKHQTATSTEIQIYAILPLATYSKEFVETINVDLRFLFCFNNIAPSALSILEEERDVSMKRGVETGNPTCF